MSGDPLIVNPDAFLRKRGGSPRADKPAGRKFRPIEINMLDALLEGLTNRQIGFRTNTTEQVAKNRMRAIFDKAGMSNRVELAIWWLKNKDEIRNELRAEAPCQKAPR